MHVYVYVFVRVIVCMYEGFILTKCYFNLFQNATKLEYEYKNERIVAICSKLPEKYRNPGTLPPELRGKYPVTADHISTRSYHSINPDLD